MAQPTILALAGSARKDSLNKKLLYTAVAGAEEAGAAVTHIDLADYRMPLYDGDLEAAEGLPENARRLKELFKSHDGLLIATAEYNSSITPLLKNTLDWVSRKEGDERPLAAFRGRTAALVATGGGLGGLRAIFHIRDILMNIGVQVIPRQYALPSGPQAIDEAGQIIDESRRKAVRGVGASLAEVTAMVAAGRA